MKQEEESLANNSTASGSRNSVEREQNDTSDCNSPAVLETTPQNPVDDAFEREEHSEENQSSENANNQLVLYDPSVRGGCEIVPVTSEPPLRRSSFPFHSTSRVLPSVGAFTVQCANCFKWRLIPTKQKYEEIREHILEQPFVCETAREWRPSISCNDEPDIVQDGSRLWAIDKPNIAQPPPGWQRLLRIRGAGSTKFADVYYESPTGKRLRSMVEIQKYLQEHPEYIDAGVNMSQFSFQIPRPLQEDYVKKRPTRPATPHEENGFGMRKFKEPCEVNPIAWASPHEDTELQLGRPATHHSVGIFEPVVQGPLDHPVKKKRTPSKRKLNSETLGTANKVNKVDVEETLHL